jgi:hypothetical protein
MTLTITERVKYHLRTPMTLGWDWVRDALIEELTAKCQSADLPPRLRELYVSLKIDLVLQGLEDAD